MLAKENGVKEAKEQINWKQKVDSKCEYQFKKK